MNIIFTRHAEERMISRKITKTDIIEAINCPGKTLKKKEKIFFQKELFNGRIEVCCEKKKNLKVSTYWI